MSTSSMSLADLRSMPHLSVSQLRAFVSCPRRFFFQYIERAEPAFRAIALAFGTAWHETIGAHLLPQVRDQYLSREELQALFRDALTEEVCKEGPPVLFDDADEDLGKCIDLGLKMLDAFILGVPRPDQVLEVERAFVLELSHPLTGEIAPVPFIGAIDAIVVDEGKTAVWELKSGKRKWSQDQLEYDPQMTAYSMAARELGHDDAELKLLVTTKTKTPDVQVERLVRHLADKQELAETALTVLAAVNAGIDYRVRGWGCKTCAHAGMCGA
jgi:putative RecB family exonuclease